MPADLSTISIPADLLPADGRFGCGPSKVRPEAVAHLAEVAGDLLGTSHRQPAVRDQVKRVRDGLRQLFSLPADYEIAVGNGGATLFWDAAVFSLIQRRSAHAVFGEFSSKFAASARLATFLEDPVVVESPAGSHPTLEVVDGVDLYALTHNETSTGVAMPIRRPGPDAFVAVDATSGAGALPVDAAEFDAYYFSPQKAFASEGGLWWALLSPAAVERIQSLTAGDRYVPPILDLSIALENSRAEQTYNTPSVSTVFLMAEQVDWLLEHGGLDWSVAQCRAKAEHLYRWAEQREWATPYVADPAMRSSVVCTIDIDDRVAADDITAVLRRHGVLDIDAYRKLGRNQLRVGVFPAVDRGDVERLTESIDHVVNALSG